MAHTQNEIKLICDRWSMWSLFSARTPLFDQINWCLLSTSTVRLEPETREILIRCEFISKQIYMNGKTLPAAGEIFKKDSWICSCAFLFDDQNPQNFRLRRAKTSHRLSKNQSPFYTIFVRALTLHSMFGAPDRSRGQRAGGECSVNGQYIVKWWLLFYSRRLTVCFVSIPL